MPNEKQLFQWLYLNVADTDTKEFTEYETGNYCDAINIFLLCEFPCSLATVSLLFKTTQSWTQIHSSLCSVFCVIHRHTREGAFGRSFWHKSDNIIKSKVEK